MNDLTRNAVVVLIGAVILNLFVDTGTSATTFAMCILLILFVLKRNLLAFLCPTPIASDPLEQTNTPIAGAPSQAELLAVSRRYELSELGCLPKMCLSRLPREYALWEDLVDRLPELNKTLTIRQHVDSLPTLETTSIRSIAELRRAYVVLGMLSHSYIHCTSICWQPPTTKPKPTEPQQQQQTQDTKDVVCLLPKQLSVPWRAVCRQLGMPEILTAAALDTWNWKLKDTTRPPTLLNLTCVSTMTGTSTEVYFHMVPCAMHARAAAVLPRVMLCDQLITANHVRGVETLLVDCKRMFDNFSQIFKQVGLLVNSGEFYHTYRPLLGGWHPNGLVLQCAGENGADISVSWKGPSAGQSVMFMLFDVMLGVQHTDVMRNFQQEMLSYIPPAHASMVRDLQSKLNLVGNLRSFVQSHRSIVSQFSACVQSLAAFRAQHMYVVQAYLGGHTATGTGQSSFKTMLSAAIESTKEADLLHQKPSN